MVANPCASSSPRKNPFVDDAIDYNIGHRKQKVSSDLKIMTGPDRTSKEAILFHNKRSRSLGRERNQMGSRNQAIRGGWYNPALSQSSLSPTPPPPPPPPAATEWMMKMMDHQLQQQQLQQNHHHHHHHQGAIQHHRIFDPRAGAAGAVTSTSAGGSSSIGRKTPTKDRPITRSYENRSKVNLTPTRNRSLDKKSRGGILAATTGVELTRTTTPTTNRGIITRTGITTPMKPRSIEASSKGSLKRSITPTRDRSFDLKKSLEGGVHRSRTIGDFMKRATSPGKSIPTNGANNIGIVPPALDAMGRYASPILERPTFPSIKSSRKPFSDHKPASDMFGKTSTAPTLFAHTKRSVEKEIEQEKEVGRILDGNRHLSVYNRDDHHHHHHHHHHRHHQQQQHHHHPNHRHHQGEAHKEVDEVREPPESVEEQASDEEVVGLRRHVSDEVSDLSCSSAGERRKIPKVLPMPTPKKRLMPQINPILPSPSSDGSDVMRATTTAYDGIQSPLSESNGDRYTIFDARNDSFDEAARNRLRVKDPLVPDAKTLTNKDKVAVKESLNRAEDEEESKLHPILRQTPLEIPRKLPLGKSRLMYARKPTVPGVSLGHSRSFVDQVEGQLEAIKAKREMEMNHPKTYNLPQKEVRTDYFGKIGAADYGMSQAAKSAAARIQLQKRSTLAKLQKVGGALFGVLTGNKDRRLTNSLSLANPSNNAGEAMIDILRLRDRNAGARSPTSPTAPSMPPVGVKSAAISNEEKKNATITAEGSNSRWFRRKNERTGTVTSQPGVILYSARGESVTSSKRSGNSSKSGRSSFFGRHRNASVPASVGSRQSKDKSLESSKDDDIISYCVVEKITTFDSAVNDASKKARKTPDVEFAVVELGDDQNAVPTHAIVINRNELENQLTERDRLAVRENIASAANSAYSRESIDDIIVETVDSEYVASNRKKVKDDASVDHIEMSMSFAAQLQQLKQLHKPPNKVPKGAYML